MTTFKHGYAIGKRSKTYMAWQKMRRRCNDKKLPYYHRYGGRGIKVCERWNSFLNFLSDMGEAPDGLTLERIDNDGPYAPWNCKWATKKEQQRNTSRNTLLTKFGMTMCIAAWADYLGISARTISKRLYRGWTQEKALTR